MATVADVRAQLAATLNGAVPALKVAPYPGAKAAPKVHDGWVALRQVDVAGFRTSAATFVALVVLGADERAAELKLDAYGVKLLDAVTTTLPGAAALEAVSIDAGGAPLYGLQITLTTEVTQ